jgi:hypothetical protein
MKSIIPKKRFVLESFEKSRRHHEGIVAAGF